jgi:trehalose/maltose hydrolase-like predicted phosphorylase
MTPNMHQTGSGAFLQAFLFGYVGLSPGDIALGLNPIVPQHSNNVTVTGIHYGNCQLDLFYDDRQMTLSYPLLNGQQERRSHCDLRVRDAQTNSTHQLPVTLPRGRADLHMHEASIVT